MTAVRVLAVAVALVVAAWFAVGVRQAASVDAAQAEIGKLPDPTPDRLQRIERRLDRAEWLDVGQAVEIVRARAVLQQLDLPRGRRLLLRVLAAEPENVEAWALLSFATLDDAPRLHERALAALRRLSPPVPAP